MKTRLKSILIIGSLITVTAGIYGGLKDQLRASSGFFGNAVTIPDVNVSTLMSSNDIYQISEPQLSPDFSLMSLNGEQINLSKYQGRVVLMSFWATW